MSDDERSGAAAEAWLARFAHAAGAEPPTAEEVERILRLAAVAAHSSQRIAAPVACWLAGRLGLELAEAIELAESVGEA